MATRVNGGKGRRVVAVGLTGGIAAGKSTALAMFKEMGALTISADEVVHALYERPSFVEQVVERFGIQVLDSEGTLDRQRLAALVRGRREELRWLEGLTHPSVAEEMRRFVDQAPPGSVVVCEVPLLFEAHYEDMFDLVVTIEAAQEHRLSRSVDRISRESFLEFDRLQTSTEQRAAGSHYRFDNNGDLEAMRLFVRAVYDRAAFVLSDMVT